MLHSSATRLFRVGLLIAVLALSLVPQTTLAHPLYDPVPGVTITTPGDVFIGESFTFTVTFDNTTADANPLTNTGYGPFVDLILPATGIDGDDGITFNNATYLGAPVVTTVQAIPLSGCVVHPYAVDNANQPIQVCGLTPGDQFITLQLPFGSFVPEQPAAELTINATLSELADLSTPLSIQARGGYQFGLDPLANPATDPSILGVLPTATANVRPTLIRLTKEYLGPEDETATGPNYPRRYRIEAEIADGQILSNFQLIDLLPNNLAYLSLVSSSPAGGSAIDQPTIGAPANSPDNQLVVQWISVTGGVHTPAAVIEFFVPLNDANGSPVLPAASGDDRYSINDAAAQGDWTPIDTRDLPTTLVVSNATANDHTLEDQSIAIQKSVRTAVDNGASGISPADVLEYTLDFQISDYFAFQDVIITDTFSDGQRFDPAFVPTLEIAGNQFDLSTAAFNAANFTVDISEIANDIDPLTDGSTTVTFRISAEMLTRGRPNGWMVGGCIPVAPTGDTGGTGGPTPDCAAYNNGATTGQIRFRTVIQQEFSDTYPSGDFSVDQGDRLTNDVIIDGAILQVNNLAPNGSREVDDSGAAVIVPQGDLVKSIYAVDGVVCSGGECTSVQVAPGGTVTYRIRYTLPTSDMEDLLFIDYLPLPVLRSTEVTGPFVATVDSAAPAAGTAKFGPSDTFYAYSGLAPSISTDGAQNSITFFYGNYDNTNEANRTIDILFTVTVRDDPFADGLFLTNQVRATEGSTNAGDRDSDSIVQIQLTEPVVNRISKGVIATNRASAVFNPSSTGPVSFTYTDGACPAMGGTLTSIGLQTNPVNSDLSGVDAGDIVTYALVVENIGSGLNGAFNVTVTDSLPAGMSFVPGTLCARDGSGATFTYTGDLFTTTTPLVLDDPGPTNPDLGALDRYSETSGRNIAIITYNAVVTGSAVPASTLTNTAALTFYSGTETGPDHTVTDPTDSASVTTLPPLANKTLVGSEINNATNANNQAVIGELVTYEVTLAVPEGTLPAAVLTDTLDSGLAFVDCLSVTASPSLSTDLAGGFAAACSDPANPVVADPGQSVTYNLGTITNSNTDNSVAETITLRYSAVVLNIPTNQSGTQLNNQAQLSWTGGNIASVSAPNVTIIEPVINTSKSADVTTGDAGDPVTFTIDLTSTNVTDAFDVSMTDVVPAGISYVPGTFAFNATACPAGTPTLTVSGTEPTLTATWPVFPPNSSCQFTYQGILAGSVNPGQTVTNTAQTRWTTLSGVFPQRSPYNAGSSSERTGADGLLNSGALNDNRTEGQVTVNVNPVAPVKYLQTTSEAHTSGNNIAIGEIARFRLLVQVPEGSSPNFQLQDLLPTGLTFLDDGSNRMAFVTDGAGITSSALGSIPAVSGCTLSGTSADAANPAAAVLPCTLPDANIGSNNSTTLDPDSFTTGTDVYFKLGDLLNQDSDPDPEFVVVEFNALVDNSGTGSNDAGDILPNVFQVLIGGSPSGLPSNAVNLTVREPALTFAKTRFGAGALDAGDTLIYDLTINATNTVNNTTAFDLVVTDTLNPNLVPGTATITAAPATCSANPAIPFAGSASFAGQALTVNANCLNPGQTLTVRITTTIVAAAPSRLDIPNTATLTYTSLPLAGTPANPTGSVTPGAGGTDTGERTGSGIAPNDYTATSTVTVTLEPPSLTKTVTPNTYTIGDQITYNIRVTLREGITHGLIVTDLLPTGLEYVNGSVQVITSAAASGGILTNDFNGTLNPTPTLNAPGGSGGDITLTFGDTTTNVNSPNDNAIADNAFVVRFIARVMNIGGNTDGVTRNNQGRVTYTNPNDNTTINITTGNVGITIREPRITTTKSVLPTSGVQAGDVVTYTVTFTNTGNWTAYDVTALDTLAPSVTYNAGSATCGYYNGSTTTPIPVSVTIGAGTLTFDGNPAGSWDIPATNPDSYIRCTYTATAQSSLYLNSNHTNSVDADWSTQNGVPAAPEVERNYNDTTVYPYDGTQDTATATFSSPAPTFSKSDNGATQATIGEVVNYTLTLTSPLGTLRNLTITDTLPAGLIFVPGSETLSGGITAWSSFTTSAPNDGSAPVTLTATFGDAVVSSSPITLSFSAIVANVASNQIGVLRENSATLSYTTGAGATQTITATDSLNVSEPALTITKSIPTPPSPIDAGGVVTYQLVVTNPGGAFSSTAHDVVVSDPLPAVLSLNTASVSTTLAGGATGAVNNSAGNTLTVNIASIPAGGSATITYTATLQASVTPGEVILNLASVGWTSLPGGDPNERNDSGGVNDYTTSDNESLTSDGYTISKAMPLTSAAHTTGSNLTIGEVATYELTVTLPEGASPSPVTVTDLLPPGLAYVNGSGEIDLTGFGGAVNAADPVITSAGSSGDDIVFTFNNPITVTNNNDPADNDFILRFQAFVVNEAANQNGVALNNSATLQVGTGPTVTSNTVNAAVVEPELNVAKSVSDASPAINQVVTFTIDITHTAASSADAQNISWSDTLPAGLTYLPGTLAWSGTGVAPTTLIDAGAPTLTVTWDSLALGASSQITYQAQVTATALNTSLTNDVDLAWTSLPGSDSNERTGTGGVNDYNDSSQVTLTTTGPDLTLTKDDGGVSATPGGVIAYTLSYANVGNGPAANVLITETVPTNTTFNLGASSSGWTCADGSPATTTCTFPIANLPAGDSGSVTFAVTVINPLPAGETQVDNTARITDDGTNGPEPTPTNNTDDDTTPITAAPDLTIIKTDGGVTSIPGGTVVYTLTYNNVGNQNATGVNITETVPVNSTFNAAASTPGWSCIGATCTFPIGNLAVGASGSVAFAVTVVNPLPAGETQIANTASIADDGFNGADPTPGNNSSSDNTPINAAPDLTITKDDGSMTTTPGGTVAYTLTYRNVGNQDATGVVITETVPANATFNATSSAPTVWSCADGAAAGTTCTTNIGNLAAGAPAGTVTFAVTVVNPFPVGVTQISNTASIADDASNGSDPTPGNNSATDTTPVDASSDLSITKTDGGATTVPGGVVTYTLTYQNTGDQNASGVLITETVPANTTFNATASAPTVWSCADGAAAGTPCTTSIGALNGGASGSVNFGLTVNNPLPSGVTQISNTATISDDGANGLDPTPADNTASDTTPVTAAPDLTITKSDGGASAVPGGVVSYTLTITNVGNQGATGVEITDTVPVYAIFNAANSTAGWSCANGDPAGTVCTFNYGSLAAGASGSVTFAVTVVTPLPSGITQISNTASVTDDGTNGSDPTPENNSSSDVTPVDASSDLSISKSDAGVSTLPGGAVIYTLSYINAGDQNATGVTLTEIVPANTTFTTTGSTSGWSCADGAAAGTTCTFTIGDLAAGASGSVTFAILVDNPLPAGIEDIDNTASIADDGANGTDPTPENNSATEDTPVNASPDLTITKSDGAVTAVPSGTITYTIDFSNAGDQDATGVVISEIVPANTTFNATAAAPTLWSCADASPAGTSCTTTIGNLAAGASGSVTFAVTVNNPLPTGVIQIDNTVSITDDGNNGLDPDPSDNTDTEDTPVDAAPDLAVSKSDADSTVSPGGVITYTITYENQGNQEATGVVISETVPANTTFNTTASAPTVWSCADGASAGSTCTVTIASLPAGGSGSITFAVTVDNPLPAGVHATTNNVSITDDGNNGPDSDPTDNSDSEDTPLGAAPNLSIVKDDGVVQVAPGSEITYTLTVSNTGNQTATGVTVEDTLPLGTSFVSADNGGTFDQNTGLITWDLDELASGATRTLSLVILVDDPLDESIQRIFNSATVTDDGENGEDPDPTDNSDDDDDLVGTSAKRITATNQDFSEMPEVAIGEIVTYEVQIQLAPGLTGGLQLADTLDQGLAFMGCEAITTDPAEMLTFSTGTAEQICTAALYTSEPPGSPNATNLGRTMTVNFGDVINIGEGETTLTVRYRVVVLDSAENLRGVTLNNQAEWTWSGGSLEANAPTVRIIEPELTLEKSVDFTEALTGQTLTFTLSINHSLESDSPAFNVSLEDNIPPGLAYIPGTLMFVSGQAPTSFEDIAAPLLRVRWDRFDPAPEPTILQFQARLDIGAGSSVTNTASANWTSLPGVVGTPQSPYNILSTERNYRPGSTIDIYGVESEATITVPIIPLPSTGFAPGVVTSLPPQPEEIAYQELGDLWLEIPSLGIKTAILGVPLEKSGWNLTWLNDQIGYLEGTAYPSRNGNTGLTAHAYLPSGLPGPFVNLSKLKWGDRIILHISGQQYIYEVRDTRYVAPNDTTVLAPKNQPWLTLLTCREFNEKTQSYNWRVSVQAALIGIEGE